MEHHLTTVAADPSLTTHFIATALCALNLNEASARLLLRKLDPDGCALALTIRNSGPEVAAEVASPMGPERRQIAVAIAINVLAPTGWMDSPVSNLTPPVSTPVAHRDLGDDELLSNLRADGRL